MVIEEMLVSHSVSTLLRCERCKARRVRVSNVRSDAAVRCGDCGLVRCTWAEFLERIRAALDLESSQQPSFTASGAMPARAQKAKAARRRP
jgi:uncharacterized Zn finger protein